MILGYARSLAMIICSIGLLIGPSVGAYAIDPLPPYQGIPDKPDRLRVVQLGDSYSSGVGAHPYGMQTYVQNGRCGRSASTYGQLFARRIGASYRNAACGGATFENLTAQQFSDGPVAAQLSAVNPQTDLVLLTMGANDFGFGRIVSSCFVTGNAGRCQTGLTSALDQLRPGAQLELDAMAGLARIKQRLGPSAKIIWLSYPSLTGADSVRLGSYDYVPDMRRGVTDFIAMQHRVADQINTEPGAELIVVDDVPQAFRGHDLDQAVERYRTSNPERPGDAWMIGAGDPYSPSLYHPKQAGYDAYAETLHANYLTRVGRQEPAAASNIPAPGPPPQNRTPTLIFGIGIGALAVVASIIIWSLSRRTTT